MSALIVPWRNKRFRRSTSTSGFARVRRETPSTTGCGVPVAFGTYAAAGPSGVLRPRLKSTWYEQAVDVVRAVDEFGGREDAELRRRDAAADQRVVGRVVAEHRGRPEQLPGCSSRSPVAAARRPSSRRAPGSSRSRAAPVRAGGRTRGRSCARRAPRDRAGSARVTAARSPRTPLPLSLNTVGDARHVSAASASSSPSSGSTGGDERRRVGVIDQRLDQTRAPPTSRRRPAASARRPSSAALRALVVLLVERDHVADDSTSVARRSAARCPGRVGNE